MSDGDTNGGNGPRGESAANGASRNGTRPADAANGEASSAAGGDGGRFGRLRRWTRTRLLAAVELLPDALSRPMGRLFAPGSKPGAIFARRASGARFMSVEPEGREAPDITFDLPPGVEEEYERIRANLLGWTRQTEARVLVIAASISGEGATTSTAQLGRTFAREAPTVLVDGNLRTPALGKKFGGADVRGLSEMLLDGAPIDECVCPTPVENLYVIGGGRPTPHPHLLFRTPRLRDVIEELRNRFTYVLFDCSPLSAYTEGLYLARQADGLVMVVHAESTPIEVAYLAKQQAERAGARILGALLTKKREHLPEALSRYL